MNQLDQMKYFGNKQSLSQLKEQSNQIEDEIDQMKEKTEKDHLQKIEADFNDPIQTKQRFLKEDYVATESYRLNKEISKLTKDKLQMEEQ